MRMRYHGGQCCGIRHLSDLGQSPAMVYREVRDFGVPTQRVCDYCEERGEEECDCLEDYADDEAYGQESVSSWTDKNGSSFHTDHNIAKFYLKSLPKETAASRMARLIRGLMEFRPASLVECVISVGAKDGNWGYDQSKWVPYLRRFGFNKVAEFVNQNSGNILHVYHLRLWEKDANAYANKLSKFMESEEKKTKEVTTLWSS